MDRRLAQRGLARSAADKARSKTKSSKPLQQAFRSSNAMNANSRYDLVSRSPQAYLAAAYGRVLSWVH